jgi:hypothetical protein
VGKKSNLILAVSVIGLIGLFLPDQTPETAPTVSATSTALASSSEAATPDKTTEAVPSTTESPTAKPKPSSTATAASTPTDLQELVSQLTIAGERGEGYDRDLFKHWIDSDGDGCNTRREVLIAEAKVEPRVTGRCDLSGGQWYSVYDQVTTNDPAEFDVDHFVPLKEAWDSGAYAWSSDKRKEFANDLGFGGSLIAVTASSNRSKSDRDPADWLPTNTAYHCRYITNWVKVKIRWGLSVDQAELSTIREFAKTCD